MSYTSKFTGPEIDNLLDSISQAGGYITRLYSGSDLNEQGKTATLTDDITNYDILIVEGGHTFENGTVGNIVQSIVANPEVNKIYAMDFFYTINVYYSCTYRFIDTKTLTLQADLSVTSSVKGLHICNVYGIKLSSVASGASSSNPIGAIIPIMGTTAPQDYLVCDGSELNISEYKELANYFETQFGSKNHFGGDGSTTFAVPDLRNEFLRGYGDRTNAIGIHQDATTHRSFRNNAEKVLIYANQADTHSPMNEDEAIKINTHTAQINVANWVTAEAGKAMNYTSRPTNVAVLFCIKYTESSNANGRSGYKEVELLSAPIECDIAMNNVHTQINKNIVLNDFTSNYDEISIGYDFYQDGTGYVHNEEKRFQVSNIVYNNSDTQSFDGSRRSFMHSILDAFYNLTYWFKDEKTVRLGATVSSQTTNVYSKYRIYSIKGIKY